MKVSAMLSLGALRFIPAQHMPLFIIKRRSEWLKRLDQPLREVVLERLKDWIIA